MIGSDSLCEVSSAMTVEIPDVSKATRSPTFPGKPDTNVPSTAERKQDQLRSVADSGGLQGDCPRPPVALRVRECSAIDPGKLWAPCGKFTHMAANAPESGTRVHALCDYSVLYAALFPQFVDFFDYSPSFSLWVRLLYDRKHLCNTNQGTCGEVRQTKLLHLRSFPRFSPGRSIEYVAVRR